MREKLKVKFLTVIWGARYIEEFARVSMPSHLAPGNLPFMAAETDFEVVIMTSKDSRYKFDEEPIFDKLAALCPVRFIFIDDLITTGNYGVTLTLAYARGIRDSGPEQTSTHFVFMNSDFVLADGSLRAVVEKLQQGHRCIMAPSLRVCSEEVLPALVEAVDDHALTMPPRQMVELAFKNLHPTVIGKTITQDFIRCTTHNQIYWQVDHGTILARYHLIFMLAIKPEVPMGPVNSYCDYGFVPELVPSGEFIIMNDSDDFFMLEIQSAAQEKQYLHCGTSSPADVAQELSRWTTREHRRFAEVDVVFRSGDLPSNLGQARAEAAEFVAKVHKLSTSPRSHADHFYWVMGLWSWASLKYNGVTGPIELPPEIRVSKKQKPLLQMLRGQGVMLRAYARVVGRLRHWAGVIPNVPIWHHLWLDSRLLLNWIEEMKKRPHQRNLLLCDEDSSLSNALPKLAPFDISFDLEDFLATRAEQRQADSPAVEELYDNIVVQVLRKNVRQSRPILEALENYLKPGGAIALYIRHENAELDPSNFSGELAQYIEEILPTTWLDWRLHASFAGGLMKRRLRLAERFLFRYVEPSSLRRLPLLVIALTLWPWVAGLTALNNLRLKNGTKRQTYSSTALLALTKVPTTAAAKTPPARIPAYGHPKPSFKLSQRRQAVQDQG